MVATRVAGVPRLVQDGRNGLLVEAGFVQDGLTDRSARPSEVPTRFESPCPSAGRRTVEGRGSSFAARIGESRRIYDDLLKTCPA